MMLARYRCSLHSGDEVTVQVGEEGIRFLLVSGKPLQEPRRPVGTDRDEHARQAARELRDGTFIESA